MLKKLKYFIRGRLYFRLRSSQSVPSFSKRTNGDRRPGRLQRESGSPSSELTRPLTLYRYPNSKFIWMARAILRSSPLEWNLIRGWAKCCACWQYPKGAAPVWNQRNSIYELSGFNRNSVLIKISTLKLRSRKIFNFRTQPTQPPRWPSQLVRITVIKQERHNCRNED
jgi:hypothetical protein